MPDTTRRMGGPSGLNSLVLVAVCSLLLPGLSPPRRLVDEETWLTALTLYGVALCVLLALSLASMLRGPARWRWAAWAALTICVLQLGCVARSLIHANGW